MKFATTLITFKERLLLVTVNVAPGEEKENLFWQQGEWEAVYIPAQFERLPFYVGTEAQSADSSNRVLCIDMDNASVSEEKGTLLFDNTGEPSNYLLEKQQILAQLLDGESQ